MPISSIDHCQRSPIRQRCCAFLGFEVLLKCALRISGGVSTWSHSYTALWQQLPDVAQREILASARDRMPGHADLTDLDRLFKAYQHIFTRVRYYYEFYEGWTLQQEHEIGRLWQEIGAPEGEADVRYYPMELDCLIFGLRTFIEARIG
jgi:hypothetical protein